MNCNHSYRVNNIIVSTEKHSNQEEVYNGFHGKPGKSKGEDYSFKYSINAVYKFTSGHMSATLFAVVVTKFPSLPLNKW